MQADCSDTLKVPASPSTPFCYYDAESDLSRSSSGSSATDRASLTNADQRSGSLRQQPPSWGCWEHSWRDAGPVSTTPPLVYCTPGPTHSVLTVGNSCSRLVSVAHRYGPVRTTITWAGGAVVTFFDARHAEAAKVAWKAAAALQRVESVLVSHATSGTHNQGTVAITPAVAGARAQQLGAEFGEVADTMLSPFDAGTVLVTFFDTRAADAAVAGLTGRVVQGQRLQASLVAPFSSPAQPSLPCSSQPASPVPAVQEAKAMGPPAQLAQGSMGQFETGVPGSHVPYGWPHVGQMYPVYPDGYPCPPGPHWQPAPDVFEHCGPPGFYMMGESFACMHGMPMYGGWVDAGPPSSGPMHGSPPRSYSGTEQSPARAQARHQRGSPHRDAAPPTFAFDAAEARAAKQPRTTLMIRNIPNKYTQKMLLAMLDARLKGHYDFFYLPIDFQNRCNLGFGFVNLLSGEATVACYEAFHGQLWEEFNSRKVCEVTYARVQGRQALVEHFRKSRFPCDDVECRPLVFETAGQEFGEPLGVRPSRHSASAAIQPPPPPPSAAAAEAGAPADKMAAALKVATPADKAAIEGA
ncbi:hypothetical protein WJX72_001280 [[Myrmecia] bisecta]|uniref:Mei2-like C-terminal RNA recognition motif domain-containing protein n=1 Tax=[Myrmecia] bisecta TaxID=41462 RepID=A0AAW1PGK1_9CHLO